MHRNRFLVLFSIIIVLTIGYNFKLIADDDMVDPTEEENLTIASSSSSDKNDESTTSEETLKDEEKKEEKEEKKDDEKKEEDDKYPVDGTVQGDALRLREWPWGPVMGKYYTGDSIKVLGEDGEFYKVDVNGTVGYMHKNYVSIPGANASRVAPYYPGNTASGGYLSKEEGTNASKNPSSPSSSSYDWSNASSATESEALANYKGGKLSPTEFISMFGPVAKASMQETGVPASVTLAQAILETGWGGSTIGDAKNLFGIKGTGPAGSINTKTREVYSGQSVYITDGFRKYYTWQQSIDDHAQLVSNGRYKSAWSQFQSDHNADAFARGIHNAGYATDPNYASSLISLMKQYNLYQWDN